MQIKSFFLNFFFKKVFNNNLNVETLVFLLINVNNRRNGSIFAVVLFLLGIFNLTPAHVPFMVLVCTNVSRSTKLTL